MNKPFDFRRSWQVNPDAKPTDAEYKQAFIDNGTKRLDPKRYYEKDFMTREWEKLWTKVWTLAGPVSDLAESGDYFLYELGAESIIVVRGDDDVIRAFYNVCPHRGNRLVFEEFGTASDFTCAFHSWKFGLTGKNKQVTDEETFRTEVLCHGTDLSDLKCEVAAGLIFVSMDPDVMPLDEFLGPLKEALELYDIEKMHVVHHVSSEWAANWKTGVDAFYELYHLHAVHPETQGSMEDYYAQYDLYPNGMSRMIVPFAIPSSRKENRVDMDPGIAMMLQDAGIDPESYNGTALEARQAIQKQKRKRAEEMGLDFDKFSDAQLTDSFPYGIFPNVQMGCHPEGIFLMRFLPHPTEPERFFYDTCTLYMPTKDGQHGVPQWMGLPEGTDVSGEIRPDIIHVPLGEKPNLGLVLDQDSELLPHVQKGVRSRGFKGPLWGEQELRLRHFHTELDRYLEK